jgi:hypothetical protein
MATESVPIQKAPTSESNHVNGSPLITLEKLKKMPIEEIWSRVAEMQQICRHKEIDLHTAAGVLMGVSMLVSWSWSWAESLTSLNTNTFIYF